MDIAKILEDHAAWLCGDGGSRADLRDADLRDADLSAADLTAADLRGANLRGADLSGADLTGADLTSADLCGANLAGVFANETTAGYHLVPPQHGPFVAYKKTSGHIIKLLVTGERSSATTRKCRCSAAQVLEIDDGETDVVEHCRYGGITYYEAGKEVLPDKWDPDRWNECSHGIHFFITREEAEAWNG